MPDQRDLEGDVGLVDEEDPEVIQRRLEARRENLVEHVAELETAVRAKLDVKARLRDAASRGRELVRQGVERSRLLVERAFAEAKLLVQRKPGPTIAVIGVLTVIALLGWTRQRKVYLVRED
jgi:hypothetical protein